MGIPTCCKIMHPAIVRLVWRVLWHQKKAMRLSLILPLLVLFNSIATISNADPEFRQERNSMIAKMDKCFQQNEVSASVCVVGIRNQCVSDFKAGRAIADWGTPRYCTDILMQYAEALLQQEISQNLARARKEKLRFPSTYDNTFNDFMRAEVSWNDYVGSYCHAVTSEYSNGTARGGYMQICSLRLMVDRVVEMRTFGPENARGAMK